MPEVVQLLNAIIKDIANILKCDPDEHTKQVLRQIYRLVVDERIRLAKESEAKCELPTQN